MTGTSVIEPGVAWTTVGRLTDWAKAELVNYVKLKSFW
jgi:hypothetical protein